MSGADSKLPLPPLEELDDAAVAPHEGTFMVSVVVETVPPKAKARPTQVMVLPMVIPELSISIPANVELAPSVVAAVGVQKTLQADAPPASVTTELAAVVKAPS